MKLILFHRAALIIAVLLIAGCDLQNTEKQFAKKRTSLIKTEMPQTQSGCRLSPNELFDRRVNLRVSIKDAEGQAQTMEGLLLYLDELECRWKTKTLYPHMKAELKSLREFREIVKEWSYDAREEHKRLKFQLENNSKIGV